jgi:epoxyqueuosine reductase
MKNGLDTWIRGIIEAFIASDENKLKNREDDPAWDMPLVGFSKGDDPIFTQFKEDIGSFYLTPIELFAKSFPGVSVTPDQLTVISWVLPHIEKTKLDNRKEKALPAERWARARIFGEEVNMKLRRHLVAALKEAGYEAVAPLDTPFFEGKVSERYGMASTWSERHTAYASGLGTFGLCDGLITPVGKAMRVGSVVARVQVAVTGRPYTDHHAYCLWYAKGVCGKCVERCPVNAISREKGHDKAPCREYIDGTTKAYVKSQFGFEGYACGLCQTGVPCESGIPVKDSGQ